LVGYNTGSAAGEKPPGRRFQAHTFLETILGSGFWFQIKADAPFPASLDFPPAVFLAVGAPRRNTSVFRGGERSIQRRYGIKRLFQDGF
jgi:hypothetical protein